MIPEQMRKIETKQKLPSRLRNCLFMYHWVRMARQAFEDLQTGTGSVLWRVFERRTTIRSERCDSNLLGGLVFAETLQAIAQAPLQRRGRVGIESHQIPQRLAAIPA